MAGGLFGCFARFVSGFSRYRKADGAAWNDGGYGVLVNHLRDGVAQQHNVLIKRLNLPLQLDAIDQIDGHRHMLAAQGVEKRVLKKLSFVTHDIFRV